MSQPNFSVGEIALRQLPPYAASLAFKCSNSSRTCECSMSRCPDCGCDLPNCQTLCQACYDARYSVIGQPKRSKSFRERLTRSNVLFFLGISALGLLEFRFDTLMRSLRLAYPALAYCRRRAQGKLDSDVGREYCEGQSPPLPVLLSFTLSPWPSSQQLNVALL